jgi:hypothetical protein
MSSGYSKLATELAKIKINYELAMGSCCSEWDSIGMHYRLPYVTTMLLWKLFNPRSIKFIKGKVISTLMVMLAVNLVQLCYSYGCEKLRTESLWIIAKDPKILGALNPQIQTQSCLHYN